MKTLFLFSYCCLASALFASDKIKGSLLSDNQAMLYQWKHFDGNRINAAINSAGPYADYLEKNSPGLEWPKGSGKTAVFTAGMWLVGKHRPTNTLRTAVMDYSTEYQPGPILGTFNTTTNDSSVAGDPKNPAYRIYKINKGDDASSNVDYNEWPGELGAPYIDVNNNGTWDKGIDTPALYGDQTLWCVFNDLNKAAHQVAGKTPPMGVEVQTTYLGFNDEGALGDVMFIKWKIINKSDADYDSVYIGLWSDIDMGDANDDMAGCDTSRDLTFIYNGDSLDAVSSGYGIRPPACGFVLIQGPQDSSSGSRLRSTSHVVFLGGGGGVGWSDPALGSTLFAQQAYYALKGLRVNGNTIIDPLLNQPTPFVFAGDPVTGTGWNHSATISAQDVRTLLSSGPFTLTKNDTQEVIGAFVIAQGVNRLQSINELRYAVDYARYVAHNQFQNPVISKTDFIPGDSTGTLTVTADGRNVGATSMIAKVKLSLSDSIAAIQQMRDDGMEGDSLANDKIFFASFTLPPTPLPYQVVLETTDSNGFVQEWKSWTRYQFVRIAEKEVSILSDHLNNNKIAERGENVRFALEIHNPNPFLLHDILITPLTPSVTGTIMLSQLPANSTATTNENSYFSVSIPYDYKENSYPVSFALEDNSGNRWQLKYEIPVFTARKAQPYRVSGKGIFDFDVFISDTSSVKNHLYTISAIDSLRFPVFASPFVLIKDSTTGVLLSKTYLIDTTIEKLHTAPTIDGFKIIPKKVVFNPSISYLHIPDSARWFVFSASFDIFNTKSSIHFGNLPNITVKFAKKYGFIDTNNNGIFDVDERPLFDTTNTERTQKAFLYYKSSFLATTSSYIGYHYVPFAVYDTDTDLPRKLTVAIVRRDTNSWLNFYKDTYGLYIMEQSYKEDGTQFSDSLSGGFNLHAAIRNGLILPYYYTLTMYPLSTIELLSSEVTTELKYSHPFSSQDLFVFNPTVLVSVKNNTAVPSKFLLDQNYPNPFNPATTIRYSLPHQSEVNLTIYNILGQRVATLVHEVQEAGIHSVVWNGKSDGGFSVASGIYFYHITAGGYSSTKKMLLLK